MTYKKSLLLLVVHQRLKIRYLLRQMQQRETGQKPVLWISAHLNFLLIWSLICQLCPQPWYGQFIMDSWIPTLYLFVFPFSADKIFLWTFTYRAKVTLLNGGKRKVTRLVLHDMRLMNLSLKYNDPDMGQWWLNCICEYIYIYFFLIQIAVGDVLCEIETDKATLEFESLEEG